MCFFHSPEYLRPHSNNTIKLGNVFKSSFSKSIYGQFFFARNAVVFLDLTTDLNSQHDSIYEAVHSDHQTRGQAGTLDHITDVKMCP